LQGKLKKGYVDLHTHGLGPCDTRTTRPEAILRLAEAHREKGTALIFPAIYPSDIKTMRAHMKAVAEAMGLTELIGGINLEGPFVNPLKCGALDRGAFLRPSLSSLMKLLDGFEKEVKIITIAPELPGALKLIEKCASMGMCVNMGHSDSTYRQADEGKRAGAKGITHLFNAMRPFHHREPGLAGFGLMDEDIYVEVIADGAHLTPETLRLIFAVKRPERIILVSDSVKGGGGRPVRKKGLLMGGGVALAGCEEVLKGAGISKKAMLLAGRENPLRYILAGC
jgi:N-acetylglucosamine-6-phosphate deacetylase